MKKFLAILLVLTMVLAMTACGAKEEAPAQTQAAAPAETQAAAAETEAVGPEYTEITLKFGTSSTETSLTGMAFMDWAERMEKASGGKVKMDVYCSSVLGNNTEMTQGAQMGTIDVVVIQPSGLADMGASKMNVLVLPYLFSSYEQYFDTLYGEIGTELLEDVTANVPGLVGFSYLADGGRCYFNNGKPITTIDDIRGMKLRVQSYAIDTSTAEAIGFSPTPTAIGELYQALDTGVVDGAEQPLSAIDGRAFYEVVDYLVLDNHTYNIPTLVVSEKTWEKLTPDTQAMLNETWTETINELFAPGLAEYEAGLLEKFKGAGVEIVELTDYDKWVEAVAPVWAEYGAGLESYIEAIQALAKN